MSTWRMAWRLATYRPGLFAAALVLWAGVHSLPVLTGLITALFFEALTGGAPLGLGPVALVALLFAVEATRMAVSASS